MKNYSSSRVARGKGKVAYRTPSRWLSGRPELFKKMPQSKLQRRQPPPWIKES